MEDKQINEAICKLPKEYNHKETKVTSFMGVLILVNPKLNPMKYVDGKWERMVGR